MYEDLKPADRRRALIVDIIHFRGLAEDDIWRGYLRFFIQKEVKVNTDCSEQRIFQLFNEDMMKAKNEINENIDKLVDYVNKLGRMSLVELEEEHKKNDFRCVSFVKEER